MMTREEVANLVNDAIQEGMAFRLTDATKNL